LTAIHNAYSTESDRASVRSNLEKDGWKVAYGHTIAEAEWWRAKVAIDSAIAANTIPGAGSALSKAIITTWLSYEIERQISKIKGNLQTLVRDEALEQMLSARNRLYHVIWQSLREKKIILYNTPKVTLYVDAGVAKYNRWERVVYHEPHTYKCKQKLPFGGWTWGVCTTMKKKERNVPLPPFFQPYVRFKLKVKYGSSPPASSTSRNYDTIQIQNKCYVPIYVAIRYRGLNNQWVTKGWHLIQPNSYANIADTKNNIFYYYAESKESANTRKYWKGNDKYYRVRNSSATYGFRKTKINTNTWGTYTLSLTCN
jgi:hypothetical protein